MSTAPTVDEVNARALGGGRAEVDAGSETIAFDAGWATEPSGLPGPAEPRASAPVPAVKG